MTEVKFLQGSGLIGKVLTNKTLTPSVDTFYVSNDASVMYAGGKPYYGAPTLAYEDNKIKLFGVSGDSATLIGSADLTLPSLVETGRYITSVDAKSSADGYYVEVTLDGETKQVSISNDEYAKLPGLLLVLHNEASSGDTHTAVILPTSDFLDAVKNEISALSGEVNTIESSVGLDADGKYVANTASTYTSGASTVADAIAKLDSAIKATGSEGSLSSPNETLNVSTTAAGTTADVNHDKVTIKQSTGKTYQNGVTIADNDLYAADAVIEEGFKVLGGTVGQLTSGQYISGGTTVIELLKKMLVKEADCTAVVPTCTLSISPTTSPVEVGTVVSETLSSTYTDGKFTGSSADYGAVYSVDAGCTQGTVTYKRGTTVVTSPDSYTMPDGITTWSCTSTYSASSVTPKKNNGADSSKTIAAGSTAESKQSITAYYKWYLGETTATSVADIVLSGTGANVSNVQTGWTSASTVTMESTWTSTGKSIFVLVKGTLSSYQDNLSSESLIPNFVSADKTISIGGTSTATYKGYLWVITNGATIAGKNIIMKKG